MITYIILGALFIWMLILTNMWNCPKSEIDAKKQEMKKNDLYHESNKARELTDKKVKESDEYETNFLRSYISDLLLEKSNMGSYEVFVDEKRVFHCTPNHTAFVRVQNELTAAGYEVTYDHNSGIMHIYWGRVPKYSSSTVNFTVTPGLKKEAEEIKTEVDPLLATMEKYCMTEPNSNRVYKVFFGGKIGYMCYENLVNFKEEIYKINPEYRVISELVNKEPFDAKEYLKNHKV